jgi:flagellar basal-body rod protein FlgG
MIKGIYTVARSLEHHTKNIDAIANNLANINTTGYKREVPFSEYIDEFGNIQIKKITSQIQGETILTSNPLDVAIHGSGFFAVRTENGSVELTRDGRFKLSTDGFLVDANDRNVLGRNGPINMDETLFQKDSGIVITNLGEIKIGNVTIDTLLILKVDSPENLERGSGSTFILPDDNYTMALENEYKISQGYLEESNTNPILEMESMIQMNKSYETSQKIIAALDQSLDMANQIGKT